MDWVNDQVIELIIETNESIKAKKWFMKNIKNKLGKQSFGILDILKHLHSDLKIWFMRKY